MNSSTTALATAKEQILSPGGMDERSLETALGQIGTHRVDGGDLYFELSRGEAWSLEEGLVKSGSYYIRQGVGVRAISGEKTGLAYSDELALPAVLEAARAARAIADSGSGESFPIQTAASNALRYAAFDPLDSLDTEAKTKLLLDLDAEARRLDPRIKQVMASLTGSVTTCLVAGLDGTLAADVRPLVRLNISVIAEQNGRRESGGAGGGGRVDYSWFFDADRVRHYVREAVRLAVTNLEAVDAPAGTMPVVLGPGWPGIMLHEAIGHGLEGDFNRKGTSAFAGRIGEQVASPYCTVVDDGTLADRRGSLNIDDEGTPSQCTVLIENGILRAYMMDKHNATLMGTRSTGNGRRESYAHRPMPRMTNTYMLAGPHDPEEIVASVDKGLYAAQFGGGQVDITNGKFVFSAAEAYLIEGGKITRPVKGATLIGHGPEVLTRVSMVGNDLKLDEGVGTCGKEGQSVPVGVGQPTLKIDAITVGGTRVA